MSKQFLRKSSVAERYDVTERTVDRWSDPNDGRLPKPVYRGKLPLWDADELDKSDRAAAAASRRNNAA